MKFVAQILFIVLVFVSSCKKPAETEDPTNNTVISATEQHMRHNWTFVHSILNDFGTNPGSDTIHGIPGDYYLFETNNKAYARWDNLSDTVDYKVLGANSFLYGGDTMVIDELSATNFVFSKRVKTDVSDYENIIRLSK